MLGSPAEPAGAFRRIVRQDAHSQGYPSLVRRVRVLLLLNAFRIVLLYTEIPICLLFFAFISRKP